MPSFRTSPIRRAATAALAGAMLLSILPAATMAAGSTAPHEIRHAERAVLGYVNDFRAKQGLAPLRMATRVRHVARDRSRSMKNQDYFAHESPSGVHAGTLLKRASISWSLWGENIGWTGGVGLEEGAEWMVERWRASSGHRKLLLYKDFNYVGIGIAREGKEIWYTMVFVNQHDHTPPKIGVVGSKHGLSVASAPGSSRKSATIKWWGKDRQLQVRTAGLRGFNVQYKKLGGKWRTILRGTKQRQLTRSLPEGWHKFRVRGVDRRGNKSDWTVVKVHVQ